jgi:prolyl oligopeptidase
LSLADASKVEKESEKEEAFLLKDLKSLPPQYDASGLVTEQRTAVSKDGTEIPYFIVMKKDVELNGKNPTLLYGYGGFEVSLGPKYIATSGLAWLERGGIYVEANIRGGGEFGPSWHQAGLKANRNKCYEDFIAVGEHLISSGICSKKTLAARGGSNGGRFCNFIYSTCNFFL